MTVRVPNAQRLEVIFKAVSDELEVAGPIAKRAGMSPGPAGMILRQLANAGRIYEGSIKGASAYRHKQRSPDADPTQPAPAQK